MAVKKRRAGVLAHGQTWMNARSSPWPYPLLSGKRTTLPLLLWSPQHHGDARIGSGARNRHCHTIPTLPDPPLYGGHDWTSRPSGIPMLPRCTLGREGLGSDGVVRGPGTGSVPAPCSDRFTRCGEMEPCPERHRGEAKIVPLLRDFQRSSAGSNPCRWKCRRASAIPGPGSRSLFRSRFRSRR